MASASANQKAKKHGTKASVSKTEVETPASPASTTSDNGSEPKYLLDLQKLLRNAVKKMNATSKVDAILAENEGKTLDELVQEKKINADQKAQALKKPALQATITQIEEQIVLIKQLIAQYEERIATSLANQKASLEKAHQDELDAVREHHSAEASKAQQEDLLTLSKFLCAASNLRRDGDINNCETLAFEGVLSQIYGGHQKAVDSIIKLVRGSDKKVLGPSDKELDFTYADVKKASERFAPVEDITETTPEVTPESDPTMVNAELTEIDDPSLSEQVAAHAEIDTASQGHSAPPQTLDIQSTSGNGSGRNPSQTETDPTEAGLEATTADTESHIVEAPVVKRKRNPNYRRRRHQASERNHVGEEAHVGEGAQTGKGAPADKGAQVGEGSRGEGAGDGRRGRRGGRGGRGGRGRRGRGDSANGSAAPAPVAPTVEQN
ncbi:hypothetical protein N7495_004557 [Penicillium taxi]|uniref:uncharacterized protein n=1 Tax=Penicillium taxi TaxID=168475 RepID=UPI002544EA83|nr:uncharacterized protein N7495_004557 [Penicillium taxi]KAJ5899813.1 hypothetical protein N7495_004557 [Penicillium taxi]